MSEKQRELRPVRVNYTCDECKDIELKFTGMIKPISPPLYVHKCTKCKKIFNLNKQYPSVEYKEINKVEKTLFKVPIGDWSKDGHNQSEDFYVYCNYPVEAMRQAYKDTCKKIGLQMNHNENYTGIEGLGYRTWRYLLTEYEESSISEDAVEILLNHGFKFSEDELPSDEFEYHDGRFIAVSSVSASTETVFKLFMWFISYSMPKDFEWEELNLEAEPIVGYWNKGLNQQIGYGVFS